MNGGGFIGVGEPGSPSVAGQISSSLDDVLGVEEERGFNIKYMTSTTGKKHKEHFILADADRTDGFRGRQKKSIFALPEATDILIQKDQEVQMAVHEEPSEKAVAFTSADCRIALGTCTCCLYRAVSRGLPHAEKELIHAWYSAQTTMWKFMLIVKNGKYCVVNNTYEPQDTVIYRGDGSSFELHVEANEIKWYQI